MAHKIMINCGHGRSVDGSWDSGCAYGDYTEAGLMLPITRAAVKYLRGCGITVLSDADTSNDKNMIADVNWANKQKVELYISIHCDYYKAPKRVMPLYVSTSGKKLATALNTAIKSGMGMESRGIQKRTDLWELNGTDMTACILETSAITDSILRTKPDAYGKCIAKGVCSYLGVKFVDPSAKPKTTPMPANRKKLIDSLEMMGKEIEKSFHYSNVNSKTTWAAAKKNHIVNCARYASWALQAAGILPKGKVIYWKGALKGSGAEHIKKCTKIKRYRPNKTVKAMAKAGTLKKGDVCMFSQGNHTMIVRSVNKSTGVVKWYTAGPSDVKAKNVRNRRRISYDNRKVSFMIRINC